jgi:hypothetical protein
MARCSIDEGHVTFQQSSFTVVCADDAFNLWSPNRQVQ